MNDNCWLPPLEYFSNYNNDWNKYETALYNIFKKDFIDTHPYYKNIRVGVKHYKTDGMEEAFNHITSKDYTGDGERNPDFRRCERIRWVRAFIENYDCDPTKCEECEGVKVWSELYKNKERIHLLLEEERYTVVLEKREEYFLLITAFYVDQNHSLRKMLKNYEQYRSAKNYSNFIDKY